MEFQKLKEKFEKLEFFKQMRSVAWKSDDYQWTCCLENLKQFLVRDFIAICPQTYDDFLKLWDNSQFSDEEKVTEFFAFLNQYPFLLEESKPKILELVRDLVRKGIGAEKIFSSGILPYMELSVE